MREVVFLTVGERFEFWPARRVIPLVIAAGELYFEGSLAIR
jgi:hypothetical protein